MSLSAKEAAALDSFRAERDHWKRRVMAEVNADPAITEEVLRAIIMAEPDPYPANKFGIKDRAALLDEYIQDVGAFFALKGLILAYDEHTLMQLDPDNGRGLPSPGKAAYRRLVGSGPGDEWGYTRAADYLEHEPLRDPDKGNFIVEQRASGTLDGVLVTVRRIHEVQLVDGAYVPTPGEWEVV